jgi:hypothetical protein
MKKIMKSNLAALLVLMPLLVMAQFDDLYFDPSTDAVYSAVSSRHSDIPATPSYRETLPAYEDSYDDYSYWDEQDYFFTSRVRRFHNPVGGFGYYDPIYSDMGFYDPWMMPGTSIYMATGGFNDYWHWRRMNRMRMHTGFVMWNSWSPWGFRPMMDPWMFSPWGAYRVYDPWFNPYWGGACFNRGFGWGMGGMGMGWGMGGFGNTFMVNNFYGGGMMGNPGFWYGNPNGTINQNPHGTHYGPRMAGARTGPTRQPQPAEVRGSGIPRLVNADVHDRPTTGRVLNPGASIGGEATTRQTAPSTGNAGRVRPSDIEPRPGAAGQTRDRRDVATPQDGPRGTVSPAAPDRRDPLGDRRRFSDIDTDRSRTEPARDVYRDNYIQQRQNDRRPSTPQADPRRDTRQSPQTAPQRDQRRATPQTAPSRDNRRSAPQMDRSPRQQRNDFRSQPSQPQMPSRSMDRSPQRSPSSGSMNRSSSPSGGQMRSSSPSRSSSPAPSRSGRSGRGG